MPKDIKVKREKGDPLDGATDYERLKRYRCLIRKDRVYSKETGSTLEL